MHPLRVLLCSMVLILPALICLSKAKHHHANGIEHVIALKVIHLKVKKYLPKLIKKVRVVPMPIPLHVAKAGKKGFVVQTSHLPDHLPPVSPCKYAKYWHPKDRYGAGCDHHFGWQPAISPH